MPLGRFAMADFFFVGLKSRLAPEFGELVLDEISHNLVTSRQCQSKLSDSGSLCHGSNPCEAATLNQ